MNKLTMALMLAAGSATLAGCATTDETPVTRMASLSYVPTYDFEMDTLDEVPTGFTISGPVAVNAEQARSGNQSVKFTRINDEENVRVRHQFGALPAGVLKLSLYVPSDVQVDTFITLFQDSYRADPDRIIDVILRPNGEIRNRQPGGPTVVGKYQKGSWNDIEIDWQSLPSNNTYRLKVNGSSIGQLPAERSGMVPARLDIKYGSGNSPTGSASVYLDAVSIH